MASTLLDDFWLDLRHSFRPALKMGLGAVAAVGLLLSLTVGVFYAFNDDTKPPESPTAVDKFSPAAYGVGFIQVFDCIRAGSAACPHHKQSKEFLVAVAPEDGIAYRPLKPTDPGASGPGGMKKVSLTLQSPEAQWQAFVAAATLNGLATPNTVSESAVTERGDGAVTYPVAARDGSAYTGAMDMEFSDSGVILNSIDYAPGEG